MYDEIGSKVTSGFSMTAQVDWYDSSRTILLQTFEGDLSLQDYYHVIDRTVTLIQSAACVVHLIVDRSGVTTQPINMARVLAYANKHYQVNTGLCVVVGATWATRMLVDLARVMNPQIAKNIHVASTREEAIALIAAKAGLPAINL
jgi:hypothetical protein